MRRKPLAALDEAHAAKLARWASFFATLSLIALLGFAKSAQALTVPGGPSVPLVLAAPADEEEEGEASASEDEEIEAEECEEEEAGECEEEGALEAPPECLLNTVDPTIFAAGNSDKVRLRIRYTTTAATAVAIDYGLHGAKGSLFLGTERKRLGRKGVLHLNRSLTETQMAKVLAARDFTVRLRLPAAPRWCQSYFDRHLDVRRATPRGLTWLQSE